MEEIDAFLRTQDYSAEVLVVENGSSDHTYQVAQEHAARQPHLRVLREKARGKGLAVRRGMLEAQGEYRFAADADFSMPVEQVNRFLPPACTCDISIASREARGAIRYGEPSYRHLTGRVYNFMIRSLVLPGLQDTQCGFKCFRGPVAEDLFGRQTLSSWAFDVEVLFMARKLGYKMVEIGIPWYFNPESKLNVVKDALRMGIDLLRIRLNGVKGYYRAQV